jgi:hypothetical protein
MRSSVGIAVGGIIGIIKFLTSVFFVVSFWICNPSIRNPKNRQGIPSMKIPLF